VPEANPRSPLFAPAVSEDVLNGEQRLRRAFLQAEARSAERGTIIVRQNQADPPAILIHSGLAYCSSTMPDGRRAITDVHLPGDFVGAENVVMAQATQELVAACRLHYRVLSGSAIRDLLRYPEVSVRMFALAGEFRYRAERHATALARLDARERMSAFLIGIYDRLRRRELINRPTFNLWLTQEEIGDHLGLTMVHVSRTLRRLREERLVLVDRHVVIIRDLNGLRDVAGALMPEAGTQTAVASAAATPPPLESCRWSGTTEPAMRSIP
jgi:CRP/FNR family transcriptional regulator, anaerobic regulatory protein